jgi:hypothetical protein
MRSVCLTVCVVVLCLLAGAMPAFAGGQLRTISDSNGRVVVELSGSNGPTQPVTQTFFVAISPTGPYSVSFQVGSSSRFQANSIADTVTVSQPFMYRGTRTVWVRAVVPAGIPLSFVTVDYTPAATFHDAASADPLLKALVVNTDVYPATPRSGSPDAWFSLTPNWVKLTLSTRPRPPPWDRDRRP